jgi:hypothetical protein
MREDFTTEFYGCPEFFVQKAATESTGDGLVRVYHWSKRGSIYAPLFTAVLSAVDLITVANGVRDHALQVLSRGSRH